VDQDYKSGSSQILYGGTNSWIQQVPPVFMAGYIIFGQNPFKLNKYYVATAPGDSASATYIPDIPRPENMLYISYAKTDLCITMFIMKPVYW
jgi:hypothetical protein